MNNRISGYWFSAPADSCVLLPLGERNYSVPKMQRGYPGISPIWYADSPEASKFVKKTLQYISSYSGPNSLFTHNSITEELTLINNELSGGNYFDPENITDDRKRFLREIVQRRGQAKFRHQLLQAYGRRCAITNCDAEAALEAAHIVSYLGESTQHVKNGLLLRADIHTLFDLRLLEVCPDTLEVILSPSLLETSYSSLHGKSLILPSNTKECPDKEALRMRWNNRPS